MYGMMGFGFLATVFMALVGLAIIAVAIWALLQLIEHGSRSRTEGARDILDRRYARGEIDKEEYERRRHELDG